MFIKELPGIFQNHISDIILYRNNGYILIRTYYMEVYYMKIVAIVGNLRKESYNLKIARFIKERFKEKIEIEIIALEDLPMFNDIIILVE